MTATTARSRPFGAAAIIVAALLALNACGGATGGGEVATAGGQADRAATDAEETAPLDEDAQALAFAECMRDNGVDMPDPAPGLQGLVDAFQHGAADHDRSTVEQALAACQGLLPQYAHDDGHVQDDEMMLELAECLREQGLDVPDDLRQLRRDDIGHDELRSAMEECRDVIAGGGR